MEETSPPPLSQRKRRLCALSIAAVACLPIALSPDFLLFLQPIQRLLPSSITNRFSSVTTEWDNDQLYHHYQQQQQRCNSLLNESIQPWTPQSSYRGIMERYLPCAINAQHDPRISRVGKNFHLWKEVPSRFKNCTLSSNKELISPSYVDITSNTSRSEWNAGEGITDMHWLLLTHFSALKVADFAGFCNASSSASISIPDRPFLIACQSVHTIDSCIRGGLAAAGKSDRIVVVLLEDKPRPSKGQLQLLASDDRVVRIFATNPSQVHPKIHPYPIGLNSAHLWPPHLDGRETSVEQRTNLLECGGITYWLEAKVVSSRNGVPLGNVVKNDAGTRRSKVKILRRNGFQCGGRMEHDDYIESMMRAKFVWSPRGYGKQNYREWEALAAGAIPLIDTPPPTHASLYEGLPVVAVSDWSRITPDYLENTWADIQIRARNGEYDMRKLYFLPYWLNKLIPPIDSSGTD